MRLKKVISCALAAMMAFSAVGGVTAFAAESGTGVYSDTTTNDANDGEEAYSSAKGSAFRWSGSDGRHVLIWLDSNGKQDSSDKYRVRVRFFTGYDGTDGFRVKNPSSDGSVVGTFSYTDDENNPKSGDEAGMYLSMKFPTMPAQGHWAVIRNGKEVQSYAQGCTYTLRDEMIELKSGATTVAPANFETVYNSAHDSNPNCAEFIIYYTFYFIYEDDVCYDTVDVLDSKTGGTNKIRYHATGAPDGKLNGVPTKKFACQDVWGIDLKTDTPTMRISYYPDKSDFTQVGTVNYPKETGYRIKPNDWPNIPNRENEGLYFQGWATTCTSGVAYKQGNKITFPLKDGVMEKPIDLFTVWGIDSPNCGDDFNGVPFVAVAVIALGVSAGVMITKRRKALAE